MTFHSIDRLAEWARDWRNDWHRWRSRRAGVQRARILQRDAQVGRALRAQVRADIAARLGRQMAEGRYPADVRAVGVARLQQHFSEDNDK